MSNDESFYFAIPRQPSGKPITQEEAERLLLEKLKKTGNEYLEALWSLAYFYSKTGQQKESRQYLDRLIANTDDPEKRAGAYLALGQLMEQMGNFEDAIVFYSQAFSLEPENTATWYLINNNLGYCLNITNRHAEAESYCRHAIQIDPSRQNAYKNLGISLAGQGDYPQAARNYIKATRANAADSRALDLLEQLYFEHPEMKIEIPDIEEEIQKCRQAVMAVLEYRQKKSQE